MLGDAGDPPLGLWAIRTPDGPAVAARRRRASHDGGMSEAETSRALTDLPGVVAVVAGEAGGAPEVAWGESFFFYDPDDVPDDRRFPFATIVTKDYPGFDTASRHDRPGIYPLDLAVGRARFAELFGFPATEAAEHHVEVH